MIRTKNSSMVRALTFWTTVRNYWSRCK